MAEERLSGSLVESLLTAMAYLREEAAPIMSVVTADMFEGIYADIASRIIEYRQRFKEPPAPAHLDDIFDHVLEDPDHKHYRAYTRILVGMREQAPSLNAEYLVGRVTKFARQQRLKDGFLQAVERFERGGEDFEDEVENILQKTLKRRIEIVSWGQRLGNDPFEFLNREEYTEGNTFPIRIPALDRRKLTPTRGELWLLMAGRKKGKSMGLQHLGRCAAEARWNVAHASLENRMLRMKPRYLQTWFGAGLRMEPYVRPELILDKDFRLENIEYEVMTPKYAFNDPKSLLKLRERTADTMYKNRMNRIIMQEFFSGRMTVSQLENWLDMLIDVEGFVPDLLIVDYPDLMKLNPLDKRGSIGQIFVDLRGLAGERNMAVAVVTQGNREGERSKLLQIQHSSEDISKAATADIIITYNQTEAERRLGLARLHVAGARNDLDGFTVLITQSYDIGQFVLQSTPMRSIYWEALGELDQDVQGENLERYRKNKDEDDEE